MAGIEVAAGIDIDGNSKYAYEINNPGAKFLEWDVTRKHSPSIKALFAPGKVKLLAGCAPCTPFSKLTNGIEDHHAFDLLDNFGKSEAGGYPPYNIERVDEDRYRITLAVAGFAEADLDIEIHENTLKIVGSRAGADEGRTYLHQGIAGRSFERRFQLADHVKVTGARLANGLLDIELSREVPEAKKPRKIDIASDAPAVTTINAANAA